MNGIFLFIISNLSPFVLSLACPEPNRRGEGLPENYSATCYTQAQRSIRESSWNGATAPAARRRIPLPTPENAR
jgi:hypothetical protein